MTTTAPRLPTKEVMTFCKSASLADLTSIHAAITALGGDVQKIIDEKKVAEKDSIREQIAALAAKSGFTLEEFVAHTTKTKGGGDATVKFRHPTNSALTWSGRGRKPDWLHELGDAACAVNPPTEPTPPASAKNTPSAPTASA